MFEHLRRRKDNPRKNKKKVWHLPQSSRNRKQTFFRRKKKTNSGDPYYNDGTMGMMQRPKRLLSILTTCKTCFLSIKEHLLNLLLKEIIYKKGKRRLESNCVVYVPRENSILLSFHPSKKVFSIGLYLVGKRQENLSKEAKK